MLKNQLFGVEVEMTGITREKAARIVAEVLESVPSQPEANCYHTRNIIDQTARKWKIMRDSCHFISFLKLFISKFCV